MVDAVSSRSTANRDLAIGQLAAGAALTSVEMCLFDLMGIAATRRFARSSW